MIDPNKKEDAQVNPSEVCYRAFELMAARQYADAEKLLVSNMGRTDDDTSVALYHSALGVLYKMQGEFKTAWRHYERAEKLLPDDPSLKIISARLLIEAFAEYDTAVRKAKKVLVLAKGNPVFAHQAYTTMGLAYARKGKRTQATEMLATSMGHDFEGFVSAQNIDLSLVEALLRKGWSLDACRTFLHTALGFARAAHEDKYVRLFEKMVSAFDTDYGQTG